MPNFQPIIPFWLTQVHCPFCQKTVLIEYNKVDAPDDLSEDDLLEINEQYAVGALNLCEHTAFASIWGYYDPEIAHQWAPEMGRLVDCLAEIAGDKSPGVKDHADYLQTNLIDEPLPKEKLLAVANGALPKHEVSVKNLSFDALAEGTPNGENVQYGFVFINAKVSG